MEIHLSFADGAAHALAEGSEIIEQQSNLDASARSAYEIGKGVHLVHLGVERLLKHSVSSVQPLLLLSNPKRDLIRDIHGALAHRPGLTIFQLGVRFTTVESTEAASLASHVMPGKLAADETKLFEAALTILSHRRNHVEHGELYGESDEILAEARQLLGEVIGPLEAYAPEVLRKVEALDPAHVSRLRAMKAEVDTAWQMLVDEARFRGPLELSLTLDALRYPDLRMTFNLRGSKFGNAIYADGRLDTSAVEGLFSEEGRPLRGFGDALIRLSGESEASLPGLFGSLTSATTAGASLEPSPSALGLLLGARSEPAPQRVVAESSGRLTIRAAAKLFAKAGAKVRFVEVLLHDVAVEIEQGSTTAKVTGKMMSARSSDHSKSGYLELAGELEYEAEYVLSEASDALDAPAGSTWRILRGAVQATSSSVTTLPSNG